MHKYNSNDGNDKMHKYNSNDGIEYESEDDGIEYEDDGIEYYMY